MSMLLHFTQLYCMLLYTCWWSIKVCDDNIYQVLHALSEIICFQKMVPKSIICLPLLTYVVDCNPSFSP